MKEVEVRYFNINNADTLECRDDTLEVSGYGIVFGVESRLLGDFKEIIHRDALNSVDTSDVLLLSQHNVEDILARTDSGTLALSITDNGVHFRANLPDTTLGRDTYTLIKRGDLKDMSFGFTVEQDTWNTSVNPNIRTVHKIGELVELSVVTRGAYQEPSISHRSKKLRKECLECRTEFEKQNEHNLKLKTQADAIFNSIKKETV